MAACGFFSILSVAWDDFVTFLLVLLNLVAVEGSEAMVASATVVASNPLGEFLSEMAAATTSASGAPAASRHFGEYTFFASCTDVCAKLLWVVTRHYPISHSAKIPFCI